MHMRMAGHAVQRKPDGAHATSTAPLVLQAPPSPLRCVEGIVLVLGGRNVLGAIPARG